MEVEVALDRSERILRDFAARVELVEGGPLGAQELLAQALEGLDVLAVGVAAGVLGCARVFEALRKKHFRMAEPRAFALADAAAAHRELEAHGAVVPIVLVP